VLTIHRPLGGVRVTEDAGADAGHAVVVDGGRYAAVGPYETLLAEHGARARVREWDGVLGPGRYEPGAAALLEATYWPDPREAETLGTEPLTGAALADLEATGALTGTRWGASARRGTQRLLARGVTALAGPFDRPTVHAAVERSGMRRSPAPAVAQGGPADFAVFAADGRCLVTVLGGRLVHRLV
jgi:plasmid stabilization system protein ParE